MTETLASDITLTLFICLISSFIYYVLLKYIKYKEFCKLVNLIPGPPTVPIFGNGLSFAGDTTNIIKTMTKWGQQYSTPYRMWFGPTPIVVLGRPEDVHLLLNTHIALDRGKEFIRVVKPVTGDGLLISHPAKWKSRRKLIASTFTKPILESFLPIFIKQSNILVKCLEKNIGNGTFNIWNYMCQASLDIICGTAMGVDAESQTGHNPYTNAANRVMELSCHRMVKVWLHPDILFYLSKYGRELKNCVKVMKKFTENVIAHKYKLKQEKKHDVCENNNLQDKKAFLDYFMEIREKDSSITTDDLREEVNTLSIAGFETTATTNACLLLMLAIHQDIQQKVYEEIWDIFGNSEHDITLEDLPQLRYLELVIKETLRLYPTVYLFQREATQDYKLSTCTVPKGCIIDIWVRYLHTDPAVWPNPEKFDPLRFTAEESAKRHSHSYIPFGAGPRNCIGLKYAYMSMKVQVTSILRHYHLSTDLKEEDIVLDSTISLRLANGYPIELTRRTLNK